MNEKFLNEKYFKGLSTTFINEDQTKLYIPKSHRIALIVDGQHRFYGLKRFYNSLKTSEDKQIIEDFEFPITFLIGFDIYQVGKVFATVNFTQKPVNRSLYYDIFGSVPDIERNDIKLAHDLALHLNNNDESPIQGMIKMLGTGYGLFSQSFFVEKMLMHFKEGGAWEGIYADYLDRGEQYKKLPEFMKEYYKTHKHPLSGKKQSRESIEKARESRRITLLNPEIRRKLGESHKGQLAWNKGKVMSKEIRQKMHKITLEEMQQIAKVRRGVCLSEEYAGSGNSLKWRCERGHEWEATPHNIKKDKWCPVCSTRIGEKICKNYFETFFQEKFPKAHPNWLKSSTGKNLELDGYCEKLKLAFEYQGEQHYIPNHYFNKTFSLEKIKQHDEFKKNKCSENKIILIQVPYHIDYEKLGRWIEEECKKIGLNPLINAEP